MALSNAERQARYRAKRRGGRNDEYHLNTWISASSKIALKRLSIHWGVTQKEALERVLVQADQEIKDAIEDDEEFEAYISCVLH